MTSDQFMAALAVWREARGESRAGKYAVYCVMVNRTQDTSKRWPSTLWEVILQPWQFSSFNAGDTNAVKWPLPKNKGDWNAWLDAVAVVDGGITADSTGGATHYHDLSIEPPVAAWLGKAATLAQLQAKETARVGRFIFYRL